MMRSWLIGLIFLLLVGCGSDSGTAVALPTIMAGAVVPSATATFIPLPVTFTPDPDATATPTSTSTPIPSATTTPTPAPTATWTPPAVKPFNGLTPAQMPAYDQPPTAVPCGGDGLLFTSKFLSTSAGKRWEVPYVAYLPPCYNVSERAYPVLYLFHGSIQTETHWADLGIASILDDGIRNGRYPPFIVIMPYNDNDRLGNNTSGGQNSIEGVTLFDAMPFVESHFCTWNSTKGRAIGGISRGAYWALMIAFRHPDLFTAVAGHSSQLRLDVDKAEYNPLVTYAQNDLAHLRIWLDWGEHDFLRNGSVALHEALTSASIPHTAQLNPAGHNEAYWLNNIQQYMDWYALSWPLDRNSYPLCNN